MTNDANAVSLVMVKDGKVLCDSLMVAEKFGKEHKNVLQSIQNIDCSPEFTELNFQLSNYKDSTGRKLPMYEMTRDGFSFLVMGFTGKEAAVWKEKYINAFNTMEETLRNTMQMMSPSQILELQVQIFKQHEEQIKKLEEKQEEHDKVLAEQKDQLHRIEAKVTTTNSEYFSVSGYASLKGVRNLDVREAAKIGKYCAKLSREQDTHIGKVKDERYGAVNIYHLDVLFQAFNELVFRQHQPKKFLKKIIKKSDNGKVIPMTK